jgi:hypothetical protein
MKRKRKNRIDWPNHLIGFFSALFGILVAFELDEWREQNNQRELTSIALERMITEIEFNQNMLHTNVEENALRIQILHALTDKLDDQLLFTGTRYEADSINRYYAHFILLDTVNYNAQRKGYPAHMDFSHLTMLTQHTSAWESAKATGVLNFMGYEKVLMLSSVYNYSSILEELSLIRNMTKQADDISNKMELQQYLNEVNESLSIVHRELDQYDLFVNMLKMN